MYQSQVKQNKLKLFVVGLMNKEIRKDCWILYSSLLVLIQ